MKTLTTPMNEKRVYRQIAFPVSAFDVLQDLKRTWGLATNGEVLTRLLLSEGRKVTRCAVPKNADTYGTGFGLR